MTEQKRTKEQTANADREPASKKTTAAKTGTVRKTGASGKAGTIAKSNSTAGSGAAQKSNAARRKRSGRSAAWERKVRKRRLTMIGALLAALLVLAVFAVWLVRRGTFETWPAEGGLRVDADGTIRSEELMALDGSSFSDLKEFVREQVRSYNDAWAAGANPGFFDRERPVTIERLLERDGTVFLRVRYQDAATYEAFTNYPLEVLTVEEAVDAGYDFTDPFVSVTDGAKGESATLEQLLADPDLAMLRIRENTRVQVPGEIVFVTDANTDVVGTDTVRITPRDGNEDATVVTFAIYRIREIQ